MKIHPCPIDNQDTGIVAKTDLREELL
jgi:hypothetical protein